MPAQWLGEFFGKMRTNKIRNKDLAMKMKCSQNWVSDVLNGKRCAKNSESKFKNALDELIAEKTTT